MFSNFTKEIAAPTMMHGSPFQEEEATVAATDLGAVHDYPPVEHNAADRESSRLLRSDV